MGHSRVVDDQLCFFFLRPSPIRFLLPPILPENPAPLCSPYPPCSGAGGPALEVKAFVFWGFFRETEAG